MSSSSSYDDIDDDTDTIGEGADKNASDLLAGAALSAALTRKARAQLKRHPSVVILAVPNAEWVPLMCQAIRLMEDAPVVRGISEPGKSGSSVHRVGKDELRWLQSGKSVLFVSQDPGGLLHEAVLAGTDVSVAVPGLTPALLRQVIRQLTGGIARGINQEMTELDLTLLVSLLRPGSTAKECVAKLRLAVQRRSESVGMQNGTYDVPRLDTLPLTRNVREWADQALADLKDVSVGRLAPDRLQAVVLEGPPGTGKTLIAESLARTSGWSFVPTSVGSWFATSDGALGGVSRNIKRFFESVIVRAPAIGFLDELDAVPNRSTMDNRSLDWWAPVVTLILTEIDHVHKSGKPVMLVGATNFYERLDLALIRPARLHQKVSVLPPKSEEEVLAVVRYCLGPDLADADLGLIGQLGQGATPAQIEGWVKEARRAARTEDRPLELGDLLEQIVPKDVRSAEDVWTVAIHEIGHALVAHRLGLMVNAVSIVPQGMSSGHMELRKPSLMPTWDQVTKLVTVALGGRAADIVVGTGAHAGAESDLAEATRLLLAAHETQGLRDDLVSRHVLSSVAGRSELHRAIGAELKRCLEEAMTIIAADRALVIDLARRLMNEKVLSGAQLATALGPKAAPTLSSSVATGNEIELEETDLVSLEGGSPPASEPPRHQGHLKQETCDEIVA
ncbi:MAG TPA: AAA family ATPase [Devosia sp.]|jgi:DNA polymerase III delta prime subunit|uniref:AAA family ATPase n=1 Tax=Devosia sp. TaxID=1871048 RepID=UPI002F956E69